MKTLLFIVLLITLGSCAKDPLKTECARFIEIKETWKDSASGFIRVDTIYDSKTVMCGEELQKLKKLNADYWVHQCAYEPQFWEHWRIVMLN